LRLVERNARVYRRSWFLFVAGALEPLLYLASVQLGLGALIGTVSVDGRDVEYATFVAPGLAAVAAMNGAVFDTTFGLFSKLHWDKTYDAVINTPLSGRQIALGEIIWALVRGVAYSIGFGVVLVTLGHARSWWTLAAVPAAVLIGFAFAGVGLAATTFMRTWQDFEYVSLAMVPMLLFSATFYPLATLPGWLGAVVALTPLYQGVDLMRSLILGAPDWSDAVHVAYLGLMGMAGLRLGGPRFERIVGD
jgi:lipooligosaccharide transport system permease protein